MTFRKGQSVWKAALLRRTPSPLPLRLFTCLSPPLTLSLWNLTRTHSCSSTETDSILLKPECLCVRSQPSDSPLTFFPFNTQMYFLLFFFFPPPSCPHAQVWPRMNLAGRASASSQLPPSLLFLSSESAFPLRSHYPAGPRYLQSQDGSSPLLLALIPPSPSSATLVTHSFSVGSSGLWMCTVLTSMLLSTQVWLYGGTGFTLVRLCHGR